MRVQTEERRAAAATIPVGLAQRFLADLASAGGDLNVEVAHRLQSQISIARITGINQIDLEAAVVQALTNLAPEPTPIIPLPTHRTNVDASTDCDEAEVEDSIDHLIDLVIDLR
ncbi:MAG: hypothetical protein KJO17_03945 [Acidimicrobiia bacterium]|nr:hypothetical protein [Acidimicrobiia bacterium]